MKLEKRKLNNEYVITLSPGLYLFVDFEEDNFGWAINNPFSYLKTILC